MFTWAKRLFLTLAFLTLIVTNVLTLTSTVFNAALSGLMSAKLGVQTVSDTLRGKLDANKKTINAQKKTIKKRSAATRRFGTRLVRRTKRVATASLAAIPGETIPLLGTTLLIAGTSYELYAACESMDDLDELYSDLGMADEVPDDVLHSVCNPSLPDVGNLWHNTIETSKRWWGKARKVVPSPTSLRGRFIEFP